MMKRRKLGQLEVGAVGLGCMSMTPIYGKPIEAEAVATIRRAIELGVDLIDTSDAYGTNGSNEELVGGAIKGMRERVVLATKFGNTRTPEGKPSANGRPEYVQTACDASLKRLGVDTIDLYYIHRVDPTVPIEDTVGAMTKLIQQGKVRHLGISEAAPATLRRAHATHPMAALQTEYSLWTREAEAELLGLCAELGIGYVAYSPLGRGFLTGTITDAETLDPTDRRRAMPRFQGDNARSNLKLVATVKELAAAENCTTAQLALAWVLSKRPFIVPLPGTKQRKWLEENAAAVDLKPKPETLAALDKAFPVNAAAGTRYPAEMMARVGL